MSLEVQDLRPTKRGPRSGTPANSNKIIMNEADLFAVVEAFREIVRNHAKSKAIAAGFSDGEFPSNYRRYEDKPSANGEQTANLYNRSLIQANQMRRLVVSEIALRQKIQQREYNGDWVPCDVIVWRNSVDVLEDHGQSGLSKEADAQLQLYRAQTGDNRDIGIVVEGMGEASRTVRQTVETIGYTYVYVDAKNTPPLVRRDGAVVSANELLAAEQTNTMARALQGLADTVVGREDDKRRAEAAAASAEAVVEARLNAVMEELKKRNAELEAKLLAAGPKK